MLVRKYNSDVNNIINKRESILKSPSQPRRLLRVEKRKRSIQTAKREHYSSSITSTFNDGILIGEQF
jgi:hypothetical protein